jgi:hypothetical protein
MRYLIDGHNLIGQMPGINLSDADDEAQLVLLLRRYANARRGRTVLVVFDRGVYGHLQRLDGYGVTCRFARSLQDADAQLVRQIQSVSRPREWTVVTSDRSIARVAQDCDIRVISAQSFADQLRALDQPRPGQVTAPGEKPRDTHLSAAEIDEWLRLFGAEPEDQ